MGASRPRNLPIALDDRAGQLRLLLRDRNAKFTAAFDAVFAAEATKMPITPVRAPRADASDVGHGDDGAATTCWLPMATPPPPGRRSRR